MESSHRIRVLWIDDNPETLGKDLGCLAPWFDLKLITSVSALKQELLRFWTRRVSRPEERVLPVEIYVVDYDLSGKAKGTRLSDEDARIVDTALESLAHQGMTESPSARRPARPQPDGPSFGAFLYEGLVAGQFAATLLADHPAGMVPTTSFWEKMGDEVRFLEWLLDGFLALDFSRRSRPKPTWTVLLCEGVRQLRRAMVRHAKAGITRFDLRGLLRLAGGEPVSEVGTFSFTSRYARREIPLEGLFVDLASRSTAFPDQALGKSPQAWAEQMLVAILDGEGWSELLEASNLADTYWEAYQSDRHEARYELSELLAPAVSVAADTRQRIKELCDQVGIEWEAALESPDTVSVPREHYLPSVRKSASCPAVARWTVLMLMVRAEALMSRPDMAGGQRATIDDIYDVLYPLPGPGIFTYRQQKKRTQKGRAAVRRTRDDSGIIHDLEMRQTARGRQRFGPHALRVKDVLEGKPWDAVRGTYGLKAGEVQVLRMYADMVAYPEADWPAWLHALQP